MREKLKRLAIYLLLLAFFIQGITGRRIDAQAAGDSGNDTQAAAIRISKTAATLSNRFGPAVIQRWQRLAVRRERLQQKKLERQ